MAIALTKPSVGSVGWGGSVNQNFSDIESSLGVAKRFVSGLIARQASATTVVVTAGTCRDTDDTQDLTLAADSTVDIASANAALGLERRQLAGTFSTTSGNAFASGSGTATQTDFAPNATPRSISGTIHTNGSPATAVTGIGTKFLTEVAVGDLVGAAAPGYSRVTAIASDTALTIGQSANFGSAGTPTTPKVIENVTVEVNGEKKKVLFIGADNGFIATTNFSSTASGLTAYTGVEVADCWYAIWVLKGASGTTVALSTQRTRPFASISNYDQKWRRVGWMRNDSSGNLLEFYGHCNGSRKLFTWRGGAYGSGTRVLAGGGATTPTAIDCSAVIPPTAFMASVYFGSGGFFTANNGYFVYPRNMGSGTGNHAILLTAGSNGRNNLKADIPVDGAQHLLYYLALADGANPAYADIDGYWEDL